MKAIITDLDRTLLRTDRTLSEYTIRIMQKCHDKGIHIMAATARPERSILEYHSQIQFDAITTMNGARILLPDRIIENKIPHQSGKDILSKLVAIPDVLISIETSEGIFSNAEIPEWDSNVYNGFPELPMEGALYKILASSKNEVLYDQIEKYVDENTYFTIANNDLVQIMSKTATKWNGIKTMLEAFSIPQNEMVYFGDDNDDIEPIRMCGTGVAVSNAIHAAIKEADYITGSNDEDGVAHFIEEKLL